MDLAFQSWFADATFGKFPPEAPNKPPRAARWAPKWQGALPHTILVAPGGEVIYRSEAAFDTLKLRKAIVGWLGRYYHSTPGGK